MRVQDILVEVDPALKSLVNPLSSVNTSIPKFDMKPSGVLDKSGNKIFNVVDNNGKVVKSFSGPNAAGEAEQFRDTENNKDRSKGQKVGNKNLKSPDQKMSKDEIKKLVKDEMDKDNKTLKKIKKYLRKPGARWGGIIGVLATTGFLSYDRLSKHLRAYGRYFCLNNNQSGPGPYKKELDMVKARITADFGHAINQILGALIAGTIAGRTAAYFFGGFPGLGWLVTLITFVGGTALVIALEKLRDNNEFWDKWTANTTGKILSGKWLNDLAGVGSGQACIPEGIELDEESERQMTKQVSMDIINSDPRIAQALKLAKKKKARSKAS